MASVKCGLSLGYSSRGLGFSIFYSGVFTDRITGILIWEDKHIKNRLITATCPLVT